MGTSTVDGAEELEVPGKLDMAVAPRRRAWVIGGAILVAIALIVTLALATGPNRESGTADAVPADRLTEQALGQLAKLTDVKLGGTVYTEDGVALHAEVVTLANGDTSATVTDPSGGTAQYLVTKDTAAVKANHTWWVDTAPAYARLLTNKWVKAGDDMGFPVQLLRSLGGKQLADTITKDTAGQNWSAEPVTYQDAAALALSTQDGTWTLYVSATAEPQVLGVGGPLADGPPGFRKQSAASYPYTQFTTAAADDPCKEDTSKKVEQAKPQATAAPQAPVLPSEDHGPNVSVEVLPTGVCTNTALCDTPVNVVNSGDETAHGTVTVSSTSGGGGTQGVTVPAGGSTKLDFQVNNPAASCTETCQRTYNVSAMYLDESAGANANAGKRLKQQNIDPNLPDPSNPALAGPEVIDLLDGLLTRLGGTSGFARQGDPAQDAIDLAESFLKSRDVDVVRSLLRSPKLHRPSDKAEDPVLMLVKAAQTAAPGDEKAAMERQLYLLHDLSIHKGQSDNSLQVVDDLVIDTQHKKVYAVTALAGRATYDKTQPERKKVKASAALRSFDDKLGKTADTLAGDTAHNGFTKVLFFYVDDTVPTVSSWSRTELVEYLLEGRQPPSSSAGTPPAAPGPAPRAALADGSGKPKIGGLVVSTERSRFAKADPAFGGTYGFDQAAIQMLTAALGANQPPSAPPAAKDLHWEPVNREHRLHGDPPDASDTKLAAPKVSGGHLAGTGSPGKTEYPLSWTEQDILAAEQQVMVPANLQNSGKPIRIPNAYGVEEWGWQWTGNATITTANGPVTVTMTMFVFADGSGRTSYPLANQGSNNSSPTGKAPTDPSVAFTNPEPPVKVPAGLKRLTQVPRYDRSTNGWTYTGTAPNGDTAKVTTDDKGTPLTTTVVQPATVRCGP